MRIGITNICVFVSSPAHRHVCAFHRGFEAALTFDEAGLPAGRAQIDGSDLVQWRCLHDCG